MPRKQEEPCSHATAFGEEELLIPAPTLLVPSVLTTFGVKKKNKQQKNPTLLT